MSVLRIAYIRTQFWFNLKSGGSVGHTLGILNGFIKKNCIVKVFSNEAFFNINNFDYEVIRPVFRRPNWLGELLYNFYAGFNLVRMIARYRPNFIYHRFSGHTFFVARIARKLDIPLILEFNSFDSWKILNWETSSNAVKRIFQKKILLKIIQRIELYNLRSASLVAVVSKPLKRDLIKMGLPEEKIIVNYNGVDVEKFNPGVYKTGRCREIKKKLGIINGKVIIGFSSTFGPWHGIPQLTEAIDIILKKRLYENIQFLIIGGGKLKNAMEKKLLGYKNVIFTGEVPYSDIQYYLAVCNILLSPHCLLPGKKEFFGSPTKLFEYMAMGKGIVASNLGQIGKVLENGKTALLVKPENVEELVNGILKMVKNKHLRTRLGKKAREVVLSRYTWDKNVERLLDKISEVNNAI
jgi:glycosyltransferase involved in cell wall biosynthesis